ncbi:DUF7674 family protein [Flavobacterium sp. CF136]|uniref:DUF7674 family protein n=1 Tax=Flavobacterium sp. (strain CF136) TaxID=1144313 RepID=UPI0002718565|nr:hypothetical protein [Flavobacterium sp. CF136]EJL63958.1 hypothetical protein PMI10_02190 [Flavobacterium sp. CF136]
MENNNWTNLNNNKIKPKEFFSELTIEFPDLKTEIENQDYKMVHFRMEFFSDYNILQIKTKNITELKRCFDFQETRIEKLNSDLINALNVSYCESLLLGECAKEMTEIIKLMPPKLKKIYVEYEEYYNGLRKS